MPESPESATARHSAAAMYAADAASQHAGVAVHQVAPGRAVATMTVREDMVNGHGLCHGGYVFLLADTAFAFACNTYGVTTVAQGADITFLSAARLGDDLRAEAVERARTGRSGLYDVTVSDAGTGAVVAEFRGRSRTVPTLPFPGDAGQRRLGRAAVAEQEPQP